jgi:hypothetical protein
MTAHLRHRHLKGDAGAEAGLLKQHRRALAIERTAEVARVGLDGGRQIQQGEQLITGQIKIRAQIANRNAGEGCIFIHNYE